MSLETLSRCTCRRAGSEPGRGGLPDFSAGEIAACLVGAPYPAQLLGLAIGAGHTENMSELVVLLEQETGEDDRRLLALAVYEAVNPGRCGTCHGTGWSVDRECQSCAGGGRQRQSDRARARVMRVTRGVWDRNLRARFERVEQALQWWQHQASKAMRQNRKME